MKWPRFDKICTTLPKDFRAVFIHVNVIIDCFKILLNGLRTWWQELRHGLNILVTALLVIAGDVEQNPGPSPSSSMGSVNNLYTGTRRESSAMHVTGCITNCIGMSVSGSLQLPESSAPWHCATVYV